ncbi:hypothetical protein B4099_1756 [Heyndrickxia coagulans]|uniref:Sodium-dependent dicarboxylate transporter SdcS n=1 Tax=Heyndrickxia coagulans TaxID=1398 RepID=A0A150KHG9_HEYCO|nr:hypothetical protein B4099_1756 [Heyndrickxia coagulans]
MNGANQQTKKTKWQWVWIAAAFAALIAITLLPHTKGLPVAGQRALAILAFALILWVTEAVSYQVSAAMIVGLIALLIGLAPSIQDPAQMTGTGNALAMALSGFSSSAVALVAAALFLAAAMQVTNLHKRLALWILSRVGTKTSNLVFGAILVSIVLAFFVPSATARAGAVVPILLGMVAAFGLPNNSKLGALLVRLLPYRQFPFGTSASRRRPPKIWSHSGLFKKNLKQTLHGVPGFYMPLRGQSSCPSFCFS